MIKEFKPKQYAGDSFNESYLTLLLRKGEFNKALKICKKYNLSIESYKQDLVAGQKKLILSHRTSELLSFCYNHPSILDIDRIDILKKTITHGDYHGFLKNCFRFQIYTELKAEIDLAINKVRPEEAVAWRKKFNGIK